MDQNARKVPVFVFPTSLKFFLNHRPTHKQLLTLYNPYDFPVRFKVLCTAPNKYTVIDPDGSIGPQACVDIVIRHTLPVAAHCNVTDKFRVTMLDHTTKQIIGKRDIEAKLLQNEPDNSSNDGDNFHSLSHSEITTSEDHKSVHYPIRTVERTTGPYATSNYIALFLGTVSILALLLPTKDEKQEASNLPPYLHLSFSFKLVLAYVLGLVSMAIFRP